MTPDSNVVVVNFGGRLVNQIPGGKPPYRWGDLSWTEAIHDCVGEELDG